MIIYLFLSESMNAIQMGHLFYTGMNTSSKKFDNFLLNLDVNFCKSVTKNELILLTFAFTFYQKVQEKHHRCHQRYPYPRCSCAVAVRSGKDVFIVDICNSRAIINFPSCGDKVMKVIKVNDRNYKVKLFVCKWIMKLFNTNYVKTNSLMTTIYQQKVQLA